MRHIGADPPPPRRLKRRRRLWPWARRSTLVPPDGARIIQFPRQPSTLSPMPQRDWQPASPSMTAVALAALIAVIVVVVTALVYHAAVLAERHRPHLVLGGGAYELLVPWAGGRHDGSARFHTPAVGGRFGFRYDGCPVTPHGALRVTIAVEGYPNDSRTIVARASSGTRTYALDADQSFVATVAVPAAAGCRHWEIASNGRG